MIKPGRAKEEHRNTNGTPKENQRKHMEKTKEHQTKNRGEPKDNQRISYLQKSRIVYDAIVCYTL